MFWLRNKKINFSVSTLNYMLRPVPRLANIWSKKYDYFLIHQSNREINLGFVFGTCFMVWFLAEEERAGCFTLTVLSGIFFGVLRGRNLAPFPMGFR